MLETLRQSGIVVGVIRFLYQLLEGFVWSYENVVRPIMRPFWKALRWAFWRYRAMWDYVTIDKKGYFSKTRAGLMVTATVLGFYIIPHTVGALATTGLFLITADREIVYLTQSQEIYPDDDVHSVKGCESLPCSDANALYYRIQPSWFNQAWSIVWRRSLFYPDYVAAAVPPGVSKCTILSYGLRSKMLVRRYEMYPDLLEVSCQMVYQ